MILTQALRAQRVAVAQDVLHQLNRGLLKPTQVYLGGYIDILTDEPFRLTEQSLDLRVHLTSKKPREACTACLAGALFLGAVRRSPGFVSFDAVREDNLLRDPGPLRAVFGPTRLALVETAYMEYVISSSLRPLFGFSSWTQLKEKRPKLGKRLMEAAEYRERLGGDPSDIDTMRQISHNIIRHNGQFDPKDFTEVS
jgi:hypothetical protein